MQVLFTEWYQGVIDILSWSLDCAKGPISPTAGLFFLLDSLYYHEYPWPSIFLIPSSPYNQFTKPTSTG